MSKSVKISMSVYTAAAVRQILFEHQKGYTYDPTSVPSRVFEIREVIADFDDAIGSALDE